MKRKKLFKFVALISLIFLAINVNVLAENDTDDNACPPDDLGPGITCGKREGACWALDWLSPIIYVHCRFTGKQADNCTQG